MHSSQVFIRYLFLAALCLFLAACRIEINSPIGGSVKTVSDRYSCDENNRCTIDVVDTLFTEDFYAKPFSGYEFAGWKQQYRGFCGGYGGNCSLSTVGFDGWEVLTSVLDSDEVFYLTPRFQPTEETCGNLESNFGINPSAPDSPSLESTITLDILTKDDPTSLVSVEYRGRGVRSMYNRETNTTTNENARLFEAIFESGKTIELQVNPDFSQRIALEFAGSYAESLGRIPDFLIQAVDVILIQPGDGGLAAIPGNILIHTQSAEEIFAPLGYIEEAILHEATHSLMNNVYDADPDWLMAQQLDMSFISGYAADFPTTEDHAESMMAYLTVRLWQERVDPEVYQQIVDSIPNRILFYDCLLPSIN
ncbi:MAG: hypothetical protein AAGF57_09200 [Pseudomonadota bacterium]